MSDKKYYIRNVETGTLEEVSQKTYNIMMEFRQMMWSKTMKGYKGKVIITGIPSEKNFFKELWEDGIHKIKSE